LLLGASFLDGNLSPETRLPANRMLRNLFRCTRVCAACPGTKKTTLCISETNGKPEMKQRRAEGNLVLGLAVRHLEGLWGRMTHPSPGSEPMAKAKLRKGGEIGSN